jgi:hypothetical protein
MDFTGSFDQDGQSGIAILTHSGNLGFPHGWTLRKAASCQNPVFPGRQPYSLSTTDPLVLNYSLVLHEEEFGKVDLEKTYRQYVREVGAAN